MRVRGPVIRRALQRGLGRPRIERGASRLLWQAAWVPCGPAAPCVVAVAERPVGMRVRVRVPMGRRASQRSRAPGTIERCGGVERHGTLLDGSDGSGAWCSSRGACRHARACTVPTGMSCFTSQTVADSWLSRARMPCITARTFLGGGGSGRSRGGSCAREWTACDQSYVSRHVPMSRGRAGLIEPSGTDAQTFLWRRRRR